MYSSAVQEGSRSSTADIRLEGHTREAVPALRHAELKRRIYAFKHTTGSERRIVGKKVEPFRGKLPGLRMLTSKTAEFCGNHLTWVWQKAKVQIDKRKQSSEQHMRASWKEQLVACETSEQIWISCQGG